VYSIASNICGYKVEGMPRARKPKTEVDDRKLYPDIGERLVIIRENTGMEPAAFAKHVGIGYTAWNNYESGYSIPWQKAKRVRDKLPWITTDYIYFGSLSGPDMARSLGLLPPGTSKR
jgi:hypothetical protein